MYFDENLSGAGLRPVSYTNLQRISNAAFSRPDQLMSNVVGVTDYLKQEIEKIGGDPARETLSVLRTKTGGTYHTDGEGRAWRVFPFIEDTVCLQSEMCIRDRSCSAHR